MDISLSSEMDELVSILLDSSKLESILVSVLLLHDIHSMLQELDPLMDSNSQHEHQVTISSLQMPLEMQDGQHSQQQPLLSMPLESLQLQVVVDI